MKYREAAEKTLATITDNLGERSSRKDLTILAITTGVAIDYTFLYIGHSLAGIAKNTKALKDIAKRMRK